MMDEFFYGKRLFFLSYYSSVFFLQKRNRLIPMNAEIPAPRSEISTLISGSSGSSRRMIRQPKAITQEIISSFIIDLASNILLNNSESRKNPVKSDIRKRWILPRTNSFPNKSLKRVCPKVNAAIINAMKTTEIKIRPFRIILFNIW